MYRLSPGVGRAAGLLFPGRRGEDVRPVGGEIYRDVPQKGLIIGLPICVGLATPVNNRIVKMLNELIVLLENTLKKEPNNENVKHLLANAEDIKKRWYNSRMTRFMGMISGKHSEPKKATK
jgi:hypothetical protein